MVITCLNAFFSIFDLLTLSFWRESFKRRIACLINNESAEMIYNWACRWPNILFL